MKRRKDDKGKVLKEGESQRKDGTYQYRVMDDSGKRRYIYAKDLNSLRKREADIQKRLILHQSIAPKELTMADVVNQYFEMHKSSLRPDTRTKQEYLLRRFQNDPFWKLPAECISVRDAKLWTKKLEGWGWAYQSINSLLAIIRPAFEAACEDEILYRNPFAFSLSKIMSNKQKPKKPLTEHEYKKLLDHMESDSRYHKYKDAIVVLYETGMRIGEFCGLTIHDLDFERGRINITHQLRYNATDKFHVQEPKTASGVRVIPMSPATRESLMNIVENRPTMLRSNVIDGYRDFLFLSRRGNPRKPDYFEGALYRIVKNYNSSHSDSLPHISPHTFRHTFCTRMILAGMDIKSVQYFMGHSTIKTTLEVYAHINADAAIDSYEKIMSAIL